MLFKRVTLFHFFGFKVKADASWFFLSVLIMWTLATRAYPVLYPGHTPDVYQFMGFMSLLGIFVSIIAHELAHAIIAEYYHMPIESITLFIFGGVAEMKGQPSHPKGEFLMAIAGPAMSALVGLFFWSSARFFDIYVHPGAGQKVLVYLADLNWMIAGFNMIPAFPLDGGRALRAVIWHIKDNMVLATRISSELGAIFAYSLLCLACWRIVMHGDTLSGMWIGLIGFFIHAAGRYAVRQTESRAMLAAESVTRFMRTQVASVSPDLTIADFVENYVYRHYQRIFPVVDRGRLVGTIGLQAVTALDKSKWQWLHVASVMGPPDAQTVITPETSAADAMEQMHKLQKEQLLIAKDGEFLGVILFRDLATYLSITLKVDQDRPVASSRGA
ncbi:MAG: CBS domain-containing protein [Alphaproteobacteria bacterium]|nr:CBS domain-containing protein [Alphaproteobacteria bacterium]